MVTKGRGEMTSRGRPDGGFLGLLRGAALIALLVGAGGVGRLGASCRAS
jgi:hypothetical protein